MPCTDSTALPATGPSFRARIRSVPPFSWFQTEVPLGQFLRNYWVRLGTRLVVSLLVITTLGWAGLRVRVWTFKETAPIRYGWDLDNAWKQAHAALVDKGKFKWEPITPGTRTVLDAPTRWWNRLFPDLPLNRPVAQGKGDFFGGIVDCYVHRDLTPGLDYPPIRMYLKTYWCRFIHEHHAEFTKEPHPNVHRTDAVMYPMLVVNFVFEILGAIGMYRLCRLYRGRVLSLVAACALWFNPAIIYNTFAWTQWDVWAITPVIWALWATLRRGHWMSNLSLDLLTGMLVGLAAMMKGQSLFVASLFPLLMVAMALTDPAPFGVMFRNFYARLGTRIAQVPMRLVPLAIGALAVVYITVLPFTLRYPTWSLAGLPIPKKASSGWVWTEIYTHQVENNQPMMSLNSWNFTTILGARYGWSSFQQEFAINLPVWSWTTPPLMWLLYLTGACFVLTLPVVIKTARRSKMTVWQLLMVLVLGYGTAFGAACALLHWYLHVPLTLPYTIALGTIKLSLMLWLRRLFLVWAVVVMLLTIRARNHIQVILAPAALFAAAYAIVPGMHDRYALWPVAFLAAAFCIGPTSTVLYFGISGIALACMLYVCQVHQIPYKSPMPNTNIMPTFTRFFNQASLDFGYLWVAMAIGITWALTQLSARKRQWLPPYLSESRASMATRFKGYFAAHLPQFLTDGQVYGIDGHPVPAAQFASATKTVRLVLAPEPVTEAVTPPQPAPA